MEGKRKFEISAVGLGVQPILMIPTEEEQCAGCTAIMRLQGQNKTKCLH